MPPSVGRVEEAWRAEMTAQAANSVRLACLLGIGAFVAFAFVDPYLAPDALPQLLGTRAALVILLAALFGATWAPSFRRWAWHGGVAACLLIGLGVVAVTAMVGGASTRYHEALLLTVFGFSLLPLPWTWIEATACYLGLVLVYGLTMTVLGRTGTPADWWSTQAVLWSAVAISGSLVRAAGLLRRSEVASRLAVEESNEQLRDANERLRELDQAKSQFFANLSHELRTPLTLALAPIDALLEGATELPGAMREDLVLARRSALRMMRLVDDLLVLSRLESAALPAAHEPVDVSRLVGALLEEVAPLARRKRLHVSFRPEAGQAWVMGDRAWLERVVMNLVANALKFSPEESEVRVVVGRVGDEVEVQVIDEGPGIPPDQLERVFERFYQVDGSATRIYAGIGIGLALARELAVLHGGTLRAESDGRSGTTLRLRLPAARPDALPARTAPVAPVKPGIGEWHQALTRSTEYRLLAVDDATERRVLPRRGDGEGRPTLLVIEDNSDMIRLLGGLLGPDYEVYTARDGESGLRMAHRHRPDLVLCDVMMPGMSGFEVVRALREQEATRLVPVLLLTARTDLDSRLEAQAHGADAFLTKPFRRSELLATIDRMLRNQSQRAAVAERRGEERVDTLVRGVVHSLVATATALGTTHAGADRLRALAERLKLLAPPPLPAPETAFVTEAVEAALQRLGAQRAARVEIDLRETRRVRISAADLTVLLTELLANAVEASPSGDPVRLVSRDDGEGVRIEVRDRGPGVPAGAQERIFYPFYSTRFGSPDAGLGLPVARSLARRHGASVTWEAHPGGGSVFVVRLGAEVMPRSAAAAEGA